MRRLGVVVLAMGGALGCGTRAPIEDPTTTGMPGQSSGGAGGATVMKPPPPPVTPGDGATMPTCPNFPGEVRMRDRTPDPLPISWPPSADAAPAAMVYDVQREHYFLFPGSTYDMVLGYSPFSVWEWDGSRWVGQTGTTTGQWPPPISYVSAVYDAKRGVTVLFGGIDNQSMALFTNQTWEWLGTSFERKSPAISPPARNLHAIGFDRKREVTVVFGGNTQAGDIDDLWEWDGESWTDRTPSPRPAAWPSAREGASLVWDDLRQSLVLFGGSFTNDVWSWDGTAWTNLTPAPLPGAWPYKRLSHGAVYDPCHSVMLVFGGLISDARDPDPYEYRRDLWQWDSRTGLFHELTPATPPDPPAAVWPLATYQPATAFNPVWGEMAIFGGTTISFGEVNGRWLYTYGPVPTTGP